MNDINLMRRLKKKLPKISEIIICSHTKAFPALHVNNLRKLYSIMIKIIH